MANRNRRSHLRNPVTWPALWRDSRDMPQQGHVCDVSPGGAFLRPLVGSHIDDLAPGDALELAVFPAAGHQILVAGEVRWLGHHPEHCWAGLGVAISPSRELRAAVPHTRRRR
jgi:hypothetical protein